MCSQTHISLGAGSMPNWARIRFPVRLETRYNFPWQPENGSGCGACFIIGTVIGRAAMI
jgi:hypothetical protein